MASRAPDATRHAVPRAGMRAACRTDGRQQPQGGLGLLVALAAAARLSPCAGRRDSGRGSCLQGAQHSAPPLGCASQGAPQPQRATVPTRGTLTPGTCAPTAMALQLLLLQPQRRRRRMVQRGTTTLSTHTYTRAHTFCQIDS